ncbi:uncharacterized protein TM35_000931030 [Trypanosoma theileri]|uniref:Uncharacterized protein n=1 Tax=Trypanosoma theileri TaxID=67003 RepID=A0A1X0NF83_9TRYP|nr:uncharacterized protein TM35_000931030 [Trypanosoma theileri]ORC82345.1 hypothetical protein TM35_000931030 [Trypanosoma theileri]
MAQRTDAITRPEFRRSHPTTPYEATLAYMYFAENFFFLFLCPFFPLALQQISPLQRRRRVEPIQAKAGEEAPMAEAEGILNSFKLNLLSKVYLENMRNAIM